MITWTVNNRFFVIDENRYQYLKFSRFFLTDSNCFGHLEWSSPWWISPNFFHFRKSLSNFLENDKVIFNSRFFFGKMRLIFLKIYNLERNESFSLSYKSIKPFYFCYSIIFLLNCVNCKAKSYNYFSNI